MLASKVEKKIRMNKWDIIKFQLLVYCYLNNIHLSQHDLSCLTLLGISGEQTLEDFCTLCRNNRIFSSNQSARNALAKAEKKLLIVKKGTNKKRIMLNPILNIQTSGTVVLDFKIAYLEQVPEYEPQES